MSSLVFVVEADNALAVVDVIMMVITKDRSDTSSSADTLDLLCRSMSYAYELQSIVDEMYSPNDTRQGLTDFVWCFKLLQTINYFI